MNTTQEIAEGFFLEEREDGTFAFIEDDEVVAEGESVYEALEALELSLELRLVNSMVAYLDAAVPEEGFWV